MTIRYSLAEIEAQCRKAARGAGCPWGIAEEAGKAARWLAAYGLPGPEALAALLEEPRGCACAGCDSKAAPHCALSLGTSLGDRAHRIIAGGGITLNEVARPLLLLPHIGRIAEASGQTLSLEWEGFRALAMPEGIALHRAESLNPPLVALVNCALCDAEPVLIRPGIGSRIVEPAAWERLGTLAHRTYVPASEASRAAGAGAGLTDND